ncbi:Abortive infection protein [Xylanimonas cellulosilytica DSM 15894]|uniref:Abortive infection protein n=1 Tax=Xylanimonas cellulosilytica (strain DSM 15894 / JCM 12276 / CECT 5975 / KCTC 9989 / LMG 20990 / NBRC 107835 / XIL07) TaxID=446471 RepID=D1BXU1_XYLCX|nr:type II CAAX endopeptidase family protein [Xylanimonas cellulosilytica]ACZ31732.1 Abortive infection protein [Xylanimonas cellulosilytica DSM 15894]
MTAIDLPAIDRGRTGIRGVISRHPLVSFFVLANLLSWTAWIPYVLSQNGLGVWDFTFPEVLGGGQILGMLPGAYLGPITSALVVTVITDGAAGLREWAARLWRWRVRWHWYAIALLGVPAALVLTGAVFSGGQVLAPSMTALAVYVPALLIQMVTTGLAEEPGWRDFSLPRLQARFGPMRASLILGPLWALWHLPLFLTEWGGWPDADWTRPIAFTVFCIAFNFVMSWVFNSTGQSLPLAMLAHVSVNTFVSILWADMFPTIGEQAITSVLAAGGVVAAVLVIVLTRGRLGYRDEVNGDELNRDDLNRDDLNRDELAGLGQVDEPVLVGPDHRL